MVRVLKRVVIQNDMNHICRIKGGGVSSPSSTLFLFSSIPAWLPRLPVYLFCRQLERVHRCPISSTAVRPSVRTGGWSFPASRIPFPLVREVYRVYLP
jgi:hypothetical protein